MISAKGGASSDGSMGGNGGNTRTLTADADDRMDVDDARCLGFFVFFLRVSSGDEELWVVGEGG